MKLRIMEEFVNDTNDFDIVDEWEDIAQYKFGYREPTDEDEFDTEENIYFDGAHFCITYNPSLNKYSWYSSIEIFAEDEFDTEEEAYDDAIECLQPQDGSELVIM